MPPADLREKLVAGAERLAALAGDTEKTAAVDAAAYAAAARDLLDAASRVEAAVTASAIEEALSKLSAEIADVGLTQSHISAKTTEDFLRVVFLRLRELGGQVAVSGAVDGGYETLRGVLQRMQRDFTVADNPVAQRQVERIQRGLEGAEQAIETARRDATAKLGPGAV